MKYRVKKKSKYNYQIQKLWFGLIWSGVTGIYTSIYTTKEAAERDLNNIK